MANVGLNILRRVSITGTLRAWSKLVPVAIEGASPRRFPARTVTVGKEPDDVSPRMDGLARRRLGFVPRRTRDLGTATGRAAMGEWEDCVSAFWPSIASTSSSSSSYEDCTFSKSWSLSSLREVRKNTPANVVRQPNKKLMSLCTSMLAKSWYSIADPTMAEMVNITN